MNPLSTAPPESSDAALLGEYLQNRQEEAFRAIVERHLPMVWAAARRIVQGDGALAEDVAQEVFSHLAAHAARLPEDVVLGAWLHRHTRYTASKAARTNARRRERENKAALMNSYNLNDRQAGWEEVAPQLDAALDGLSPGDRDALVLRYFEGQDFRSMAARLGSTEDAVRMRTARALEKLRERLGRNSRLSPAVTVAVLAVLLRENARAAAPAGLLDSISAAAASQAPAGGFSSAGAVKWLPGLALVALVTVGTVAVGRWCCWLGRRVKPKNGFSLLKILFRVESLLSG